MFIYRSGQIEAGTRSSSQQIASFEFHHPAVCVQDMSSFFLGMILPPLFAA